MERKVSMIECIIVLLVCIIMLFEDVFFKFIKKYEIIV